MRMGQPVLNCSESTHKPMMPKMRKRAEELSRGAGEHCVDPTIASGEGEMIWKIQAGVWHGRSH